MSARNRFGFIVAVFLSLLLVLACSLTSSSVSCSVPDLIHKLNTANSNPAHSTLELAAGCTYTLTAVDNSAVVHEFGSTFEYGDNGLPMIYTPITINGNGATITRAEGAPPFRFFFITDPGTLVINDLTLSNGYADKPGAAFPSSGGAIYNRGRSLEVNNSDLEGNVASAHGGAIFNIDNATTHVNGSSIMNNESPRGGGIYVYHGGLLSISDSEISENEGTTEGGGINLEHGAELNIVNSTIASNHSGRRGGGIFKDGGADSLPTVIDGTTFRDNSADWGGGGVFIWRTPLTITDSDFENNSAEEYGGGLAYQDHGVNTIMLSGVNFNRNAAGWDGGGIHFSGALMTVSGGIIQQNTARNGAGIHNGFAEESHYITRTDSELILSSTLVQENEADEVGGGAFNQGKMTCGEANFIINQAATLGGGIHNIGELDANGCKFEKNHAGFDGGGICSYAVLKSRGSEFLQNTSTRGAGLASIGGDAEINDSDFMENTALESGGGIFNMGPTPGIAVMNIISSDFEGNHAMYGGGIASSVANTKLVESTFSLNTASKNGGAILNNGSLNVEVSNFLGNEAADVGGGILNMDEASVSDSTFKTNRAVGDGGGFINLGQATIISTTFVDNSASNGGGLASTGGETDLTNDTFSANTAFSLGGGIYVGGPAVDSGPTGQTTVNFVTAAFNSAVDGGGIAVKGGALNIKNSIIALNAAGGDCSATSGFSAISENLDTDGSCPGFTVKEDPLLDILTNNGGPTDTHALKSASPAIEAAPDCTTLDGIALLVDQRGFSRPGGAFCDLGAYEDETGLPSPFVNFTRTLDCRLEPASSARAVASFQSGETANVVGRNINLTWYQVQPENLDEPCWVWAGGVEFEGDLKRVVIVPSKAPVEVEEETPDQEPAGCLVQTPNGTFCQSPCPPKAVPGTPCTP